MRLPYCGRAQPSYNHFFHLYFFDRSKQYRFLHNARTMDVLSVLKSILLYIIICSMCMIVIIIYNYNNDYYF